MRLMTDYKGQGPRGTGDGFRDDGESCWDVSCWDLFAEMGIVQSAVLWHNVVCNIIRYPVGLGTVTQPWLATQSEFKAPYSFQERRALIALKAWPYRLTERERNGEFRDRSLTTRWPGCQVARVSVCPCARYF